MTILLNPLSKKRHQRFPLIVTVILGVILVLSAGSCLPTFSATSGTYPPFIKAALEGDITETQRLLEAGEFVNQTTIGNQTALHVAAAEGQDDMVYWLLEHDANPLAQDQNGKTPADFAKSQNNMQTAQIILDYVQLLQDEAEATKAGDLETLRDLLSQDRRGITILHLAAQSGETQIVMDEIAAGSDVNVQTKTGLAPLHKAVAGGSVEVCRMLLEAGADVNARDVHNGTPLYYAAVFGNEDLVRLLLDAGADPDIPATPGNETALDRARSDGNTEIITLLEQK